MEFDAKQLFKSRYDDIVQALREKDYSSAPFGLDYEECYLWLKAEQSTLQWVLEMME